MTERIQFGGHPGQFDRRMPKNKDKVKEGIAKRVDREHLPLNYDGFPVRAARGETIGQVRHMMRSSSYISPDERDDDKRRVALDLAYSLDLFGAITQPERNIEAIIVEVCLFLRDNLLTRELGSLDLHGIKLNVEDLWTKPYERIGGDVKKFLECLRMFLSRCLRFSSIVGLSAFVEFDLNADAFGKRIKKGY